MPQLCRWATVHWVRFDGPRSADSLDLGGKPQGCASWKIGPDGKAAADGSRLPGNVWCALGFYRSRADAEAAFEGPETFLPFLEEASEYWQALLQPVSHKGECNHLDRARPGPMFEVADVDVGGPMFVMTTAGFDMAPGFDLRRVIRFRQSVDAMREVVAAAGSMAHQVFAPHTAGDDGVTMSVWRDKDHMTGFAYRSGPHRNRIDEHKGAAVMDRSSFTRFRAIRSSGVWGGVDPVG